MVVVMIPDLVQAIGNKMSIVGQLDPAVIEQNLSQTSLTWNRRHYFHDFHRHTLHGEITPLRDTLELVDKR